MGIINTFKEKLGFAPKEDAETSMDIPMVGDLSKDSGLYNLASMGVPHGLPVGIGDIAGASFAGWAVEADAAEKMDALSTQHPELAQVLARQLQTDPRVITAEHLVALPGVFRNSDVRTDNDASDKSSEYLASGAGTIAAAAMLPLPIPFVGRIVSGFAGGWGGGKLWRAYAEHKEDKYFSDTISVVNEVLARKELDETSMQALLALRCDETVQQAIEEQLDGQSIESALMAHVNGGNSKLAEVLRESDMLIRVGLGKDGQASLADASGAPISVARAYANEGLTAAEFAVGDLVQSVQHHRLVAAAAQSRAGQTLAAAHMSVQGMGPVMTPVLPPVSRQLL